VQDVNYYIIEKYKKMHARLENKIARKIKKELQARIND